MSPKASLIMSEIARLLVTVNIHTTITILTMRISQRSPAGPYADGFRTMIPRAWLIRRLCSVWSTLLLETLRNHWDTMEGRGGMRIRDKRMWVVSVSSPHGCVDLILVFQRLCPLYNFFFFVTLLYFGSERCPINEPQSIKILSFQILDCSITKKIRWCHSWSVPSEVLSLHPGIVRK